MGSYITGKSTRPLQGVLQSFIKSLQGLTWSLTRRRESTRPSTKCISQLFFPRNSAPFCSAIRHLFCANRRGIFVFSSEVERVLNFASVVLERHEGCLVFIESHLDCLHCGFSPKPPRLLSLWLRLKATWVVCPLAFFQHATGCFRFGCF